MITQIKYQDHVMEAAREAQLRTDRLHVVQRGGSVITEFAAGSYVTLEYPEPSVPRAPTKLVARRAGPFQVHSSVGADYEIRDLQSDKLSRVHVKRLRAFVFDETRVDPATVVDADRSEFLVDYVLDHLPKENPSRRRRELRFKIRWVCGVYIRIIPPNGVLLLPRWWWLADTLPTIAPFT